MTAAVFVYVLFVVVQSGAALLGVALTRWGVGDGLSVAASADISPQAYGLSMLVCEGQLALALWLWFTRFEPALRAAPADGSPAWSWLRLPAVRRELVSRRAGWFVRYSAVSAVLLLAIGLSFLTDPLHLPSGGTTEMFDAMKRDPFCLLQLCFVGPLAEELVFRAGIVRSLFRSSVPGWVAAVVGALTFALVHGNWAQAVPAFIVGLALGLLYLRTGNLSLCLPAHVANNVLAVVLLYFPESADASIANHVVCGVLFVALGCLQLSYTLRRRA